MAAAADLHLHTHSPRRFRRSFTEAARRADVLLLAGDLTQSGKPEQAHLVAEDVAGLGVPVIAVLGNHDYDAGKVDEVTEILTDAGVRVLEGDSTVVTCRGVRLGIAGCKGYGGGFGSAVVGEHGEPQTRAFVHHTRTSAKRLATALRGLDCDLTVVLTHYAPVTGTLDGEPRELYAVLGSERLGRVIDEAAATLSIHGHAHHGREHAQTPGGIPVRNVAYNVINTAYRIYNLHRSAATPGDWHAADEA